MGETMSRAVVTFIAALWILLILGWLPIYPVVDRYENGVPVIVCEAPLDMLGRADRITSKVDNLFTEGK